MPSRRSSPAQVGAWWCSSYDAGRCRGPVALAEARSVDEVKDIRDKASALKAYARQAKNKQLEVDAAEIRIRAERRLGEMLKDAPKNTGAMGIGTSAVDSGDSTQPPTLDDMGISRDLSSRAQAIAAIPEETFEATLAEHRAALAATLCVALSLVQAVLRGLESVGRIERNGVLWTLSEPKRVA